MSDDTHNNDSQEQELTLFSKIRDSGFLGSSATIIAVLTAISYLITYVSNSAYLMRFGLSSDYINIRIEDIINNFIYVVTSFLVIILVINTFSFVKVLLELLKVIPEWIELRKKKKKIYKFTYYLILSIIIISYLFGCAILSVIVSHRYNISNTYQFILMTCIIYIPISAVFLNYDKIKKITKYSYYIFAVICTIIIFGVYLGNKEFDSKSYQITVMERKYIIVDQFNDGFIVAPITEDDSVIPVYSYIESSNLKNFYEQKIDDIYIDYYNAEYFKLVNKEYIEVNLNTIREGLISFIAKEKYALSYGVTIGHFMSDSTVANLIEEAIKTEKDKKSEEEDDVGN